MSQRRSAFLASFGNLAIAQKLEPLCTLRLTRFVFWGHPWCHSENDFDRVFLTIWEGVFFFFFVPRVFLFCVFFFLFFWCFLFSSIKPL